MTDLTAAFLREYRYAPYPAAFTERYTIVEALAMTEQSETLLVKRMGGDESYVAKVLSTPGDDAEARLLSELRHPALPRLYDSFSQNGVSIHVREYVPGMPLDKALRAHAFSRDEIIDIALKLCEVLGYLHSRRPPVIHRDVKPENVIYGEGGRVTLIDLGISRTYKPKESRDTVFSGTNDFAPPEQYGFSQTDARSDVYSLGMLIKFLATNGAMDKRIEDASLARVVARCTAFSPKERFSSMRAVRRALLLARHPALGRLAFACAALCAAAAVFLALISLVPGLSPFPREVKFVEPAMEQAVRLMVNKPEGELTREDLNGVTQLYLVRKECASTQAEFFEKLSKWYADGTVYGLDTIKSIADAAMLPNLEMLCVVSNDIVDISPLASLSGLSYVELKHNYIVDPSPLSGLQKLIYVGLTGNPLEDITPLAALPNLTQLDLTGDTGYRPDAFQKFGDFDHLSVVCNRLAFKFLSNKKITTLRLGFTGIDSLEWLDTVTGLRRLELDNTLVTDIEGIEMHEGLEEIDLSNTAITDLSPLLKLPLLWHVILSEDMRPYAEVFSQQPWMTIEYV